jgi:NADH:ubiquinone oxidoreductase subunit F (NADH-binding)
MLIPTEPYVTWDAYRAANGGSAIARARAKKPEAVLEELKRSGLRGRGGAGFPAGVKWASVKNHPCPTRTVVCNAAEGEPGTFKDRWLLRRNPYAVLEGILVGAHVVGASQAWIAMKASFRKELDAIYRALDQMAAGGALGAVELQVFEGPEEYLFGEEKALLSAIEGDGPLPRSPESPPYEVGLFAEPGSPNPALVSNAETFAHAAAIVRDGAAAFRRYGTEDTPGTIIFTVSGDVRRPGVYERAAGITLRDLFYEVAGGPRAGRKLKLALAGVSAAPITPDRFDTPAEFGALHLIGSGLGSAGFVLYDDLASVPRVAQMIARFLYVESCNQCSACKAGLRTASSAIDELFDPAKATSDDPERALYGARGAPQGNRCYLPVQGSIVIPSLLARFKEEFDAQLRAPELEVTPVKPPKLVDFDEATATFTYDEHQPYKKPDWTFEEPPPAAAPRPAPTAQPAAQAGGALAVVLKPDVARALAERAHAKDVALDRLIDQALRDWLARS